LTKFIVGRKYPNGGYDLSECPMHDYVEPAVSEMVARVSRNESIAPVLNLLKCEVEDGAVGEVEEISTGAVILVMLQSKRKDNHD
jgi:hypothetical protein